MKAFQQETENKVKEKRKKKERKTYELEGVKIAIFSGGPYGGGVACIFEGQNKG